MSKNIRRFVIRADGDDEQRQDHDSIEFAVEFEDGTECAMLFSNLQGPSFVAAKLRSLADTIERHNGVATKP